MTSIKMETRQPCHVCGGPCRWLQIASVRVNKRSLRQTSAIGIQVDKRCPECRARQGFEFPDRWWLDAESTAVVAAVRKRRGWPSIPRKETVSQSHDVGVEETTVGVWVAACPCGWSSEDWEDADDALLDGDDHRNAEEAR